MENDSVLSNNTNEQAYMNKTKSKEMIDEICPSGLTSKVKGRLDMVHTAAQSMDRRKLSTIAGMSFAGGRKVGAVPETQGGPRKIQYRGQLMDQVMKLRNRQV